MGMAAILINGPRPFVNFQSPINRRPQEKLEENWPSGFRGEVVQRWDGGTTDGRTSDEE